MSRHAINQQPENEIDRQKHGVYLLKNSSTGIQHRLSRADRLQLAVTLASSILQLYQTPWLEDVWQKDEILFIQRTDGPVYGQPFITRHLSSAVSKQTKPKLEPHTHPVIRNPVLFALGVLLIELCLSKPLEQLRLPEEMDKDGHPNPLSNWMTANRLVDEIYMKGGSRYGDAVRHCIRCDFDRRDANLEREDFQQAGYDKIVSLLEKDLKDFHGLR
ncbi:hypothetical protein D8B26_000725 [Coccidioides posadasii str. Silveira]|uniref:uncharacterized protein n=1 Tax=Coccidioides posadasii (strain RMSCC 757 / Silveira) TaxID=443226 RepID=UPI001BEF4263|nr:hypothetical protein D8B26_000725 [Coccidioides posadasii str. Silveira]